MKTLLILLFFVTFSKFTSAATVLTNYISTAAKVDESDESLGMYDFRFTVTAVDSDVYMSRTNLDVWFINSITKVRATPLLLSTTLTAMESIPTEGDFYVINEGFTRSFRVRCLFKTWEPGINLFKAHFDSFQWRPTIDAPRQLEFLPGFESEGLYLRVAVPEPSTSLLGLFGVLGLLRRRR